MAVTKKQVIAWLSTELSNLQKAYNAADAKVQEAYEEANIIEGNIRDIERTIDLVTKIK